MKKPFTGAGSTNPTVITAVLASTGLIVSFMQTLLTPLVPDLPRLLDTSPANASWVITVTLLAGAICTPIAGRLGDMFGKKKIALILLTVLTGGSILAAASTGLWPLVAGRALQGAGLGIIPLGISMLRDTIPTDRLGRSVALMSSTLGVGGAIGMPLSAFVSQRADWHVLFWLAAALSTVGVVLIAVCVPGGPAHRHASFDYIGAIGLAVGLSGVLLAVSKGADWGWLRPATLTSAGVGVAVLLAWGVYQWNARSPLVDLRVSARRPVLLTNIASIAVGFGLFASTVVLPKLIEMPSTSGVGLGQSIMVASLCMVPTGLIMMATSPIAARISERHGPRTSLIIGGVTIALGYGLAMALMTQVWHTVLVGCFIGVGIGFAYAALPTLIMRAVPDSETAAANGLNTLMRSIGTSTASAITAMVLAQNVIEVGSVPLTTASGFRLAFAIAGLAAVAAVVVAFFIPTTSKTSHESAPVADEGDNEKSTAPVEIR
ncbi:MULTISPECIES: MFS transporter [Nocardiaceae]|uniref:MFS transporter n=1 Tax=Nocardiaceae TaxID=85025 RepID=UPI0005F817A3|nr:MULTISPECIES: MFS transporter [Rhodococcus]KJV03560.1 putative multidrug resistance transporter, MSF family protein [Rhodococcus sp. PML026]